MSDAVSLTMGNSAVFLVYAEKGRIILKPALLTGFLRFHAVQNQSAPQQNAFVAHIAHDRNVGVFQEHFANRGLGNIHPACNVGDGVDFGQVIVDVLHHGG